METSGEFGSNDNDPAAEKLAATLKAFIRKRAEELLPLGPDDRDARYSDIHAAGVRLAQQYGGPEGEAEAWALKIILLTRAMVEALEEQASPASRTAAVMQRDRAEAWRDARELAGSVSPRP